MTNIPKEPSEVPYTFRAEFAVDSALAEEAEALVRNKLKALGGDVQIPLSFDNPALGKKEQITIPPQHVEEVRKYLQEALGSKIHAKEASIEVIPWTHTLLLQDNTPDTGNAWTR